MTREECQAKLLEYLYDLLDPEEKAAVEKTLAEDADCRAALHRAEAQKKLLGAAAKEPFADVRFTAPADRPTPAPTAERPAATRRDGVRYTLAASIALLLAGVAALNFWWTGEGERRTALARAESRYEEARSQLEGVAQPIVAKREEVQRLRSQLQDLGTEYRRKADSLGHGYPGNPLYLAVTGPDNLEPGAVHEFHIEARDLEDRPVKAAVSARLLAQDDKPLCDPARLRLEPQEVGHYRLVLPPDLPLNPGHHLRLLLTARSDGGAVTELALDHVITASRPVYVTHLTTDKPMYRPGETVHFRSLTLERFSLKPVAENLTLNYRVTSPNGEEVFKLDGQAILMDPTGQKLVVGPDGNPLHGVGGGDFPIANDLNGGEYTLTVNEALQRFPAVTRKFVVNKYAKPRLKKELEFTRKSYGPGDEVVAACKVTAAEGGRELANQPVTATVTIDGETLPPVQAKTDQLGTVAIRARLPKAIERGDASIAVRFTDGANVETLVRPIPVIVNKFALHLYPEGGDLVADVPNRVYFQARTPLDKPAEVTGQVLDPDGQVVADLRTFNQDVDLPEVAVRAVGGLLPTGGAAGQWAALGLLAAGAEPQPGANQGMGSFTFTPAAGKQYRVRIDRPAGATAVGAFPAVKPEGVTLALPQAVLSDREPLTAVVRSVGRDRQLLVGAYCRGRLMGHQVVDVKAGEAATVKLTPNAPVGGVYRVTVFERRPKDQWAPVAERLAFRAPAERLNLALRTQREKFLPGEKALLSCLATDEQGRPTPAILMVAVVDKNVLTLADEKTARTMPTHFLLTTEVQKPDDLEHADFFLGQHPQAPVALDLLLGTQGWRRFAEQDVEKFRERNAAEADRYLATIGATFLQASNKGPVQRLAESEKAAAEDRERRTFAEADQATRSQLNKAWAELGRLQNGQEQAQAALAAVTQAQAARSRVALELAEYHQAWLRGTFLTLGIALVMVGVAALLVAVLRQGAQRRPWFVLAGACAVLLVGCVLGLDQALRPGTTQGIAAAPAGAEMAAGEVRRLEEQLALALPEPERGGMDPQSGGGGAPPGGGPGGSFDNGAAPGGFGGAGGGRGGFPGQQPFPPGPVGGAMPPGATPVSPPAPGAKGEPEGKELAKGMKDQPAVEAAPDQQKGDREKKAAEPKDQLKLKGDDGKAPPPEADKNVDRTGLDRGQARFAEKNGKPLPAATGAPAASKTAPANQPAEEKVVKGQDAAKDAEAAKKVVMGAGGRPGAPGPAAPMGPMAGNPRATPDFQKNPAPDAARQGLDRKADFKQEDPAPGNRAFGMPGKPLAPGTAQPEMPAPPAEPQVAQRMPAGAAARGRDYGRGGLGAGGGPGAGGGFGNGKGAERAEDFEAFRRKAQAVAPLPPLVVRQFAHTRSGQAQPTGDGRRDDTETLYWHPVLVLPANGRQTVNFELCDSLTTFQATAFGYTLDGRIGAATTTFAARLPFSVEPKLPVEVTATDKIDVPVAVANDTDARQQVDLLAVANGMVASGSAQRQLNLAANQRGREVFRFKPEGVTGEAKLTFLGRGDGNLHDEVTRSLAVVPDGFPVVGTRSDVLEKTAVNDVVMPDTWVRGSLEMRLQVFPSTLAELQAGLEGLLREPHGCFEQTSSANYPNALILNYLKETDKVSPEVEKRARELLDNGYRKLTSFECQKPAAPGQRQGYEWFGGTAPPHEALTAYGLMEFRDMANVFAVDPSMVARTRGYLLAARDGQGGFTRNPRALDSFGRAPAEITNAYIVWGLTEAGGDEDLGKELMALKMQARGSNDPYFLALVANCLLNRGQTADAVDLLKKLTGLQKKEGYLEGTQTSITGSAGRDLQIETTALALLGWLKANRPGDFHLPIQAGVKWLGQQRGGYGGYGSTQATILALKALIAYTKANKKTAEGGELRLLINDQEAGKLSFPAGAQEMLTVVPAHAEKLLHPGKNVVRAEISGNNVLPYTLTWTYRTLQPASAEGCPVRLDVKLDRKAAVEGETVRLTATVKNVSGKGQGMAVAIVGLPAGLTLPEDFKQLKDYARLQEDGTKPGRIAAWETRGRELILYWRDLAPDAVKEVPVDLICRVPGEYRGPASRAYLYYNADAKHWVAPLEMAITPRTEK